MNCKHVHKLMSRTVDGLTSQRERTLLDQHLSECPRCLEEFADIVSLDRALSEALPLQETLGDGFATQVAAKLPVRGSRLPMLREAFVMSRVRYAVLALVVLGAVIGCLYSSHSGNNQALAAVQRAMARAASLHYTFEPTSPGARNQKAEVWSTPSASKSVGGYGWTIVKQGVIYTYLSRYKTLFMSQAAGVDPSFAFNVMVDPRTVADVSGVRLPRVTIRDVRIDERPMLRIEIEYTKDKPQADRKEHERLVEKMREVVSGRGKRKEPQDRMRHVYVTHVRLVFVVEPSTNLVRSMDIYAPNQRGSGWSLVARCASIDYNIELPKGFFEIKTPPGTRVYDLREHSGAEKGASP
jgi:hypothetical protein